LLLIYSFQFRSAFRTSASPPPTLVTVTDTVTITVTNLTCGFNNSNDFRTTLLCSMSSTIFYMVMKHIFIRCRRNRFVKTTAILTSLTVAGALSVQERKLRENIGQMAAWIKMPLGMELGLSPGDFVSDGDPLYPPQKGERAPTPIFGPFLLWPNGCIHQDAMPLGMEVSLSPGDFVLDGDPAP